MHILIAPDSYKGSLTARQVCDILAQALLTHPGVTVATLPLSDGGEGFGTCCVDACKGDILYTNAVDLYGNAIQAPLYTWGDTALIECAATCALQTKKDIMAASSYGAGTTSSGLVNIRLDLHDDIAGRDVLLVEDILDTGNTLSKLVAELKGRHPASLKLCVLLDKPERRTRPLEADYVGFTIPDAFVVGCGLDYDQKYRQLPYIGVLKPSVYE